MVLVLASEVVLDFGPRPDPRSKPETNATLKATTSKNVLLCYGLLVLYNTTFLIRPNDTDYVCLTVLTLRMQIQFIETSKNLNAPSMSLRENGYV